MRSSSGARRCSYSSSRAGLINEIFGEDCAPESRMEKLGELLASKDGIIDLSRPVRMRLVYSCTSKSGGKNEYIGEFVVKHIATEDYVVDKCDVGDDGENWAQKCTELWTSAENEKMEDFEAWKGQDARMPLLGELIATDSSTPIMLERDCVHQDGGPYRMLTVSLVAGQLQIAMEQI